MPSTRELMQLTDFVVALHEARSFEQMPTPGRPSAQARAIRALCAPPAQRAEALRAAFEVSMAAGMEEVTQCPGVQARLNRHAQMAQNLGVYASPFFVVDKQIIAGFDAERLQRLLGTSPNESH